MSQIENENEKQEKKMLKNISIRPNIYTNGFDVNWHSNGTERQTIEQNSKITKTFFLVILILTTGYAPHKLDIFLVAFHLTKINLFSKIVNDEIDRDERMDLI